MRRLEARSAGATGWRAALIRALKPNPYQLAKIAGCRPDQLRRWLSYPTWLVQKGRRFLAASTSQASQVSARREADLVHWLSQPAPM